MTAVRLPNLKWRWALLVPLLVVAVSVAIFLLNPLAHQTAQHLVFDQFQRWYPRQYQEVPVRIVDIDDASLQHLGQWPWPRTRIAELTHRLQAAGSAVIAFDMVFSEPDRTSPAAMLQTWKATPELRQQLQHMPDHDDVLAGVLGQGRVVLGFALDRRPQHQLQLPASKASFVAINAKAMPYVPEMIGSVSGLPKLVASAQGHGALSFVPDADGVVRRVPTLVRQGEVLLPTLTLEALRVAMAEKNIITRAAEGVGLEELRVGPVALPTSGQGELWVHYSEPVPARYIPAWKVLTGQVPDENLAKMIVLVGASAQGLMDLRFSAQGRVIPGVEIHAQVLEQVLTGDGLQRPAWSSALELSTLVVGGLLVGLVALRYAAVPSLGVFSVLLALVWGTVWAAFRTQGWLLDPVGPSLTMALSFGMTSIVRHVGAERRQRWVRQAFSRYVSPNLVNYLVKHPQALKLSGQRQQCSFVFTDLEGFTSLMESMDPAAAVALVNQYLDGMIAIAFAHQGTLTRIVGDGLAIVFSAPLTQTDHPRRALACAMEMQRFSHRYASDLNARRIAFGHTRMGVHCGEVIVGNFGGSTLLDYRALGDPVNTAARLEGANRYLGTRVCVSQAILEKCLDFAARPIGRLMLKGKAIPIMVFEPLEPTSAPDADYHRAYELLRHDDAQALEAFTRLAADRPTDRLVAMHQARLARGGSGDLIVMEGK